MKTLNQTDLIPLCTPCIAGNEEKYVVDAVKSGWVSTGGKYLPMFEQALAEFLQTEDMAVCQSGTAALHLALMVAGVKAEDAVLVSPLTFIASVNPVRYLSAKPVFIDCDDSLCLDPVKLEAFCREECSFDGTTLMHRGHRVRAVIVVHVFGNMADMEAIMVIAERYHLMVIEDAAEALGTCYTTGPYAGRYAGTIGHFGVYSFNGNKIITTGGGGAVTSRVPQAVEYMRYLSAQAKDDPVAYVHHEVGFNYRMTNMQAALGVAQMEKLPEFLRVKRRNYERYRAAFAGCDLVELMPFREGTASNKWFYSLKLDPQRISATIQEVVAALYSRGVEARPVWRLVSEQQPYRQEDAYRMEKAPFYASRILNIPCGTQLQDAEIDRVAGVIRQLLQELARA